MFTDSHCHLAFPELRGDLDRVLRDMAAAAVTRALCICTTLEEFPVVHDLALQHDNLWATAGVHPDSEGVADMHWQRDRFRVHIRAARQLGKPLVIHTRSASSDTLAILREQGEDGAAGSAGGVFHCFTETAEVARAALDLGFHVSFSGILTFKNAQDLRDIASFVPLERLLIETDSPYLTPVPHRGKANSPAYVPFVAQQVAAIKGLALQDVAHATSANFDRLFKPDASSCNT